LTGTSVAGATIVLTDVVAKTVESDVAANVHIVFDGEADDVHGEDAEGAADKYGFTVKTGSGNDVVDMSDVTLTRHASIDLGEGDEDRLIITTGRNAADAVGEEFADHGSLSEDDIDVMFKGVRGVEVLEFGGDDALAFNDDAELAGFEKL